jgi:hypothetical protein
MNQRNGLLLKIIGVVFSVILLGSIFYIRASRETDNQRNTYTNFFVFWLSGDLILHGQNPYDPGDWQAGHAANGYEQPAESIFLYPLPLAVLLSPLGFFPYEQASLGWKFLSQGLVAMAIFILLRTWQRPAHQRLFVPLVLICLYYGPVLLTQRSGSMGAITLLIISIVIILMEKKEHLFLSGFLLAFTMLKPPQGLLILLLLGIWLLARKDWKIIQGIITGGIVLWLIGASVDLNWVTKFLHSGEAAFDRRLGLHSNVWSFSHLICEKNMACTYGLGAAAALALLGLTGFYLWKKQAQVTAWEAMNLIIPVGFISTVYLWAYDQILYVVPIIWIVGTLVQKTKSYVHAFLFLILMIVYAFHAMERLIALSHDLWSLGNTLIVFAGLWLASLLREKPEKIKAVQA